MVENRIYRATDANSGLEGRLTILRGSDGGASAVMVELSNPTPENDVILKVNSERSAFILLTVTDAQGNTISAPARKFRTDEAQQFGEVRIGSEASRHWREPLSAQLDAARLGEQGMQGRLVVNLALLFCKVKSGQPPKENEFASSLLTFYDMDVQFTKAALLESSQLPAD